MNNKRVIIISSPSGGGKGTIIKELLNWNQNLSLSVSATTRKIRKGESEGVNYYYLSEADFREKIQKGELLEYEEVYKGVYYGTLNSELERLWSLKKIILFEIDVDGAINLKKHFGRNALTIFIDPPSLSVLEDRLRNRGTDDEDSIKTRLLRSEYEISKKNDFDRVIINDDLEKAVKEVKESILDWLEKF